MTFDITKARRDTPSCEKIIHFNNAGASLMPKCVADAVIGHLRLEELRGGYEAAAINQERIVRVYAAAAEMLNCSPGEIAVVENATRAWDMAFYSIPFKEGDRILTSMAEYASNYIAFLQISRRTGAVIEVIPNDEYGQVSLNALEEMIDERARLIAVTHIPTNGGLINPAAEIGRIAKKHGVLYLLDACQSVGQMELDVVDLGCDFLSATGRKFLRGPRGTGFLYARKELLPCLEPVFLDLHAALWTAPGEYVIRPDARRFENWETNYAGKLGLAAALDYALFWGLDNIQTRVFSLADSLRDGLGAIPGVTVRDMGLKKCGIVSFTADSRSPDEIKTYLAGNGINVSVSGASSTRLDMTERGIVSLVRASVHYYNTEEEADRLCHLLKNFLK